MKKKVTSASRAAPLASRAGPPAGRATTPGIRSDARPAAGPGFGKLGSIDPARLFKLPLPMQAEGIRLLFEMGLNANQVKARLGLSGGTIDKILAVKPFTRGGDINVVAEGV